MDDERTPGDGGHAGHGAHDADGVPTPAGNGTEARDDVHPLSRRARREEQEQDYGRALRYTALSFLVPGSGLAQTRQRAIGLTQLGLTVLGVAALGALLITKGPVKAASTLAANPTLLLAIGIALAVMGIWWVVSIWATSRMLMPWRLEDGKRRTLTALALVLSLIASALTFQSVRMTLVTQDAVRAIFSGGDDGGAGVKIGDGPDPWINQQHVNILLLGSDAGVGREGTRTDSMIVASIDTRSGKTTLISLPRNLEKIPLPPSSPMRKIYPSGVYGSPTCKHGGANDQCMLNAVWADADALAKSDKTAYPSHIKSPGRTELRNVIEYALGITINQVVVVDLKGFEQLIDSMGGVTVNVQLGESGRLPIGGYQSHYNPNVVVDNEGWFKAGPQKLNGHLALWYARARATDSDTARQGRQRCVIKAVVKQVNPTMMLTKFTSIMQIAKDNIYTDISQDHLQAYVDLVQRMQGGQIVSLPLDESNKVYSGKPDYKHIQQLVQKAINPPPPPAPKPAAPRTTNPDEMPDEEKTPTPTPTTTSATPSATPSATSTAPGTVVDPCDVLDPSVAKKSQGN